MLTIYRAVSLCLISINFVYWLASRNFEDSQNLRRYLHVDFTCGESAIKKLLYFYWCARAEGLKVRVKRMWFSYQVVMQIFLFYFFLTEIKNIKNGLKLWQYVTITWGNLCIIFIYKWIIIRLYIYINDTEGWSLIYIYISSWCWCFIRSDKYNAKPWLVV